MSPVAAISPSPASEDKKTVKNEMNKALEPKPEAARGTVSIQAIPWGYVRVDGSPQKWETPVRKLPLKVGVHTVEVSYESENLVLSSKVMVEKDRDIVCVANFHEDKVIRCGE